MAASAVETDQRPASSLDSGIASARAGVEAAKARVIERCRRYLMKVAAARLDPAIRGRVGPSDVVQVTLQEAHRDFGHFTGTDRASLCLWMRRILINNLVAARKHEFALKRSVKREAAPLLDGPPLVAGPAQAPRPSEALRAQERRVALVAALDRLPRLYREVVDLHHRDGLTFADIGERIGRSPEASRKLWARAVERLRILLEEAGHD